MPSRSGLQSRGGSVLILAAAQQQAREKFRLWQEDAFNAALHFKPLIGDVWSVRVSQHYRALARRKGSLVVWFWVIRGGFTACAGSDRCSERTRLPDQPKAETTTPQSNTVRIMSWPSASPPVAKRGYAARCSVRPEP